MFRKKKKTTTTPLEKLAKESQNKDYLRPLDGKVLWNKEFLHFITSGFDYKGQFNGAFQSFGKSVKGEVGADLGDIFFPKLSPLVLEAKVSMELKRARHTFVAAEVNDFPLHRDVNGKKVLLNNPERLSLMCMQGYYTSFAAGPEIEAGVKLGLPSNTEANAAAETLGFGLSAKASAQASTRYKGTYIHVSDLLPHYYHLDEKQPLQKDLLFIYKTSLKSQLKKGAVEYINGLDIRGIHVKYSRRLGFSHIPSQQLIDTFIKILDDPGNNLTDEQKKDCFAYMQALRHYSAEYKFNQYCSLRYWGHEGSANAGISASAEASAYAPGFGAGVSVTAKGPSVNGSIKYASYRLQTISKYKKVKTQDTIVTYKQVYGEIAGIEAEGSIVIPNKEFSVSKGKTREWAVLNSIAYTSAICYWSPSHINNSNKKVRAREGSGICFAHSVTSTNLIDYYNAVKNPEEIHFLCTLARHRRLTTKQEKSSWAFIYGLAAALRVTPKELELFLNQREARDLLDGMDLFSDKYSPGAVILEATFNIKKGKMLNTKKKRTANKLGQEKQGLAVEDLIDTFEKDKKDLQSIRLRYRLCDFGDYGEVKFTLGFKLVVSVGIELCRISEAGTDGLVDLCTCWFQNGRPLVQAAQESVSIYDKRATVPPTVLVYQ